MLITQRDKKQGQHWKPHLEIITASLSVAFLSLAGGDGQMPSSGKPVEPIGVTPTNKLPSLTFQRSPKQVTCGIQCPSEGSCKLRRATTLYFQFSTANRKYCLKVFHRHQDTLRRQWSATRSSRGYWRGGGSWQPWPQLWPQARTHLLSLASALSAVIAHILCQHLVTAMRATDLFYFSLGTEFCDHHYLLCLI